MASESQEPEPSHQLLLPQSLSSSTASSPSSPHAQARSMSPHAFVIIGTECGETPPQSPQRQHLPHHHHHHHYHHHHHHHHQLYEEIQRERRRQEPAISLQQESSLPSPPLPQEVSSSRSTSAPAPLMVVVVLVILTVVFQLPVCQAIRIVEVDVPAQAVEGDTVRLGCRFKKEGDSLYTLTWWWNDNQFFKYNPHASMERKMKIHQQPGIIVDKSKSGLTTVVLQNVTRATSGKFKCEVLAERPSFEKDSKNKTMDVVDLPDRTPVVEVERAHYSPGDILVANCTSLRSRPAPSLGWSVNGHKVNDGLHRIISKGNTSMGLFSPTSQLRLPLRRYHFDDGDVEVTCAASIGSVYDQRSDVSVRLSGPRAAAPTQKLYGTGTTASYSVPLYVTMSLLLTGLPHF